MRNTHLAIILILLVAYGCDNGGQLPAGPSTIPPASSQGARQPVETPIALGQTVSSRVTDDDPICRKPYPFRCQYFLLPVPEDGVLDVTIWWSAAQRDPYPLDMEVIGPSGGWSADIPEFVGRLPVANGPSRVARGPAIGGSTYVIEVWSFLTPHEPFELITSLEQR